MRRSESVTSSSSPTLKTSSLWHAKEEFTTERNEIIGAACTVRRPPEPQIFNNNKSSNNSNHVSNDNSSNAEVYSGRGCDDNSSTFCGTILEVRLLYRASTSFTRSRIINTDAITSVSSVDNVKTREGEQKLYAYVRRKDGDHRNGGWFPVTWIELTNNPHYVINYVHLNPIYSTITTGMSQTMRSEKELDYLEERLSRDCKSPTCVRFFVYLNKFIFAPWYYAPYGLLNSEFDPLTLIPVTPTTPETLLLSSSAQEVVEQTEKSETKDTVNKNPSCSDNSNNKIRGVNEFKNNVTVNPYIRDAYLCPFSLRVYSSYNQMKYETRTYRANRLHPPGEEIYRDDNRHFSLFEINGSTELTYCRHLFLLGKSFLENKLAGHDVHNYFFYVFCLHHCHYPEYINDDSAMYFAGYFTWEKQVAEHNLACIVTLPCFAGCSPTQQQKETSSAMPGLKGIGQFMIATSYELARRRHHVGSPEKPLSDLGAVAYDRYWQEIIIRWMNSKLLTLQKTTITDTKQANNTEEEIFDVDNNNAVFMSKRPRTEYTEKINEIASTVDESNRSATVLRTDWEEQMSLNTIAKETGLEEADVLRTLLAMGLLHRNAENKILRLVIPPEFVQRQMAMYTKRASSLRYATFDKQLLLSPLLNSKNRKRTVTVKV